MTKLFKKRNFNFNILGKRIVWFGVAAVLLATSIVSFATRGLNYGIDFEGGVLVELTADHQINMDSMRKDLNFLRGLSIQSIGLEGDSVLIQAQADEKLSGSEVVNKIKDTLGAGYTYNRVETIGPRIGQELKEKSLLASVLALVAIAVYIWFRFEWPFAVGCLLSLAYNLIVVTGAFSLFQWEFDMIVVAGLLSLAGYSCNDTIVTYDRVRENLQKFSKMDKDQLLNKSINETLSRTIFTSLTTLFVLIVLLVVGGATLQGFSIAMSLGVVIGTCTSVFLAVTGLRYFNIHVAVKSNNVNPFGNVGEYTGKK